MLGFQLPELQDVLYVGSGMILPPLLCNYVMTMLPAQYQNSAPVYYAVKAASVVVPAMLVKKFVSPRAGSLMLLGGAASLVIDLIRTYMPQLLPAAPAPVALAGFGRQPFLGYYERAPYQRTLGKYGSNMMPSQRGGGSAMLSTTPDRLDPGGRF